MTRLNDFDILNAEVKYHWESESKISHYQSNSFFKKLGNVTRLNDFDTVNAEVKYHWESESKISHYQSNSFFKKISFCLTSK